MTIIINGKTQTIAQNTSLKKVLLDLGLYEKVMASAVNMQIVKQDNWDNYILKDGDKLELLDFVGGG
jgi:sulfur carrier protein